MVTKTETVNWSEFVEFRDRISRFKLVNGRFPNYADIKSVRVYEPQYVDAFKRVTIFVATNHRNPYTVDLTGELLITPPPEWVYTAGYQYDKQDTGYTCGPTSMSMLLSELGIKQTEAQLAKLMHTTTNGTGHQGFFDAMKSLGLKCYHDTIDNISWAKLVDITRSPDMGAIFHEQISTDGVAYDYEGKLVWSTFRGGHYVYLAGINNVRDLLKVADPTKGEVTYRFGQLQVATKLTLSKVKVPGVIVVSR